MKSFSAIGKAIYKMEMLKIPDEIDYKFIITDKDKQRKGLIDGLKGIRVGDCVASSFSRYKKLYEIGVKIGKTDGIKRCRGYRNFDLGYEPSYHYWVENNGMVYDECLGQLKIFKRREDYYSVFQIKEIAYAEFYCFFNDEELSQAPSIKVLIEKKLFVAIDYVIKVNEES